MFAVTDADIQEEAEWQRKMATPNLEEVLEIVKGGKASIAAYATGTNRTEASATAMLLYNLAKHFEAGVPAQHQQAARTAATNLMRDLLSAPSISSTDTSTDAGSQSLSLLTDLEPKTFALCAWSSSKLHLNQAADVELLCMAIIQHSINSGILNNFQWVDWSQLLYGLAMSGITCSQNPGLQVIFDSAATRLPPTLPTEDPQRASQAISNILYAAGKAGAEGSKWQEYVAAVVAGHKLGTAMVDAFPQQWANMVWACRVLKVYNPEFLAAVARMTVAQAEDATPQNLCNTLHALAGLGWYEPALYDALLEVLSCKLAGGKPQEVSNALYACCLVQHNSEAVQRVVEAAVLLCDFRRWKGQDLSNTLLACAVLQRHVRGTGQLQETAAVAELSRVLFATASQWRASAFSSLEKRQLFMAQQQGQRTHQACLPAGSPLLKAIAQEWQDDKLKLVRQQPLQF
jgi:hypothetical protein